MKSAFPQRRPTLFSVALLVVFLGAYLIAGTITYLFRLPSLATYLIGDGALALIAILLLSRLHWWRESGFQLSPKPRSLWLFFVVTAAEIIIYTVYSVILMLQVKPQVFGIKLGITSMLPLA